MQLCFRILVLIVVIQGSLAQFAKLRLPYVSPAKAHITKAIFPEPTSIPRYSYNYVIDDPLTGDKKTLYEYRNDDVTQGSYSVIDSDGTTRIIDYFVKGDSGFNAVIRRI